MKHKQFQTAFLVLALLFGGVFAGDVSASAEQARENDPRIILNEDMMAGEACATYFRVAAGTAECGWNAETGRSYLKSAGANTVVELPSVPSGLDSYTLSADLCLTDSTYNGSVIIGMGIHSPGAWSKGFYFQMNVPSAGGEAVMYVNNINSAGAQAGSAGSSTKQTYKPGYAIGTGKIQVTIQVDQGTVSVLYDGTAYFSMPVSELAYSSGKPFFVLRANSTLEIDNLSLTAPQTAYPQGTVLFREDMITDPSADFRVPYGGAVCSWNQESGRIVIKASKNSVIELAAVPSGLESYTVSADLMLSESTYSGTVLFGMGVCSPGEWSKGMYFQMNLPTDGDAVMYTNNYDIQGKTQVGGGGSASKTTYPDTYKIGSGKVNVTIRVSAEEVTVAYDGVVFCTLARSALSMRDGKPFFILREKSTLEIDNLTVYTGTKDADPLAVRAIGTPSVSMFGYQTGTVYEQDGVRLYDIRLVAAVNSLDFAGVGFEVTASVGRKQYRLPSVPSACVYESVNARTDDGRLTEIKAPEGSYLTVLTVTGIPESELPEFSVAPYVIPAGESTLRVYTPCTRFSVSLSGVGTEA